MIIETVRDLREALAQWDPELKVAVLVDERDEDGIIKTEYRGVSGLKRSPGVFDRTLLLIPWPGT
jgi:hypothetical protein